MNEKLLERIAKEQRPALVVDDDPGVHGGEYADKAITLREALEFIDLRKDTPYKIAYLDVMLPKEEGDHETKPYGIKILGYLQDNFPETKVVMISGTHKFFEGLEMIPKWEVEDHIDKYLTEQGDTNE